MKKLLEMPDSQIDYSDIPELDFMQLGNPVMGKFYRPVKKAISIRMDADVLAWFKSQSEKYQQLINAICRQYYLQHRKT